MTTPTPSLSPGGSKMYLAVVSTGHHNQGRSAVNIYQAAEEIGGLSELFLEEPDGPVDLAKLIEMVDILDNANRNIRSAVGKMKSVANREIE